TCAATSGPGRASWWRKASTTARCCGRSARHRRRGGCCAASCIIHATPVHATRGADPAHHPQPRGKVMEYNKVNAGSGAQWLLDGITLLRRHPGTLLVIGLVYGVLASIPVVSVLVGALGVV